MTEDASLISPLNSLLNPLDGECLRKTATIPRPLVEELHCIRYDGTRVLLSASPLPNMTIFLTDMIKIIDKTNRSCNNTYARKENIHRN